jgi:hypothetical protein
MATQNANSMNSKRKRRTLCRRMDDAQVAICAITHTNLPTQRLTRWRSGHVLFNSGPAVAGRATGAGFLVSPKVTSLPGFDPIFCPISERTASLRFNRGETVVMLIVH